MYDFAHCLSDSIEGITIRYVRWNLRTTGRYMTVRQRTCRRTETTADRIAGFNLSYTILSKKADRARRNKRVNGWDDPRMPTVGE